MLLAIVAFDFAATSSVPFLTMAAAKNTSASKGKGSSPTTGSRSHSTKKALLTFKKTASPVSVKDSRCVDIMFEIFKAYDERSHVCCFYLRNGQTDGFSKPINDAITSG